MAMHRTMAVGGHEAILRAVDELFVRMGWQIGAATSVAGTPVTIGWVGGDEHRSIPGSLIDISLVGLVARVETFPPREIPVWLRLDGPCPSPQVEATVVTTIKRGQFSWTRRQVALRFVAPCPRDFFAAAIEGFHRQFHDAVIEGFRSD